MSERAKVTAKKPGEKRDNIASREQKTESSKSQNSPIEHILFLEQTIGNHAVERLFKSGIIQAKLKIGKPGDIYEQEADRVADAVMRMPEPQVRRQAEEEEELIQPKPLAEHITPLVQRQVEEEEEEEEEKLQAKELPGQTPSVTANEGLRRQPEEEEEEMLQAKDLPGQTSEVTPNLETRINAIRGGGQPLPVSTRAFFERQFGYDFSRVRIHTDSNAAEMARGLNARAFTIRKDIYLGLGQYKPGTSLGKKLFAHELAHTIQQAKSNLLVKWWKRHRPPQSALSGLNSNCIQMKEDILEPKVTKKDPLVRLLKSKLVGVTVPYVNKIKITTGTNALDNALPTPIHYTAGRSPNSCKVRSLIDIYSQAKIITATNPGPKGWVAKVPYKTIKNVFGITKKSCAAKKGNIRVRMVAAIGDAKFAKWVREAEGDHEEALKVNHNKYLKVYHDLVNTKVGKGKNPKRCATKLANRFRKKEVWAIKNWVADMEDSVKKLDRPGGPHKRSFTAKVIGKCSEVLVTIER